MKKKLFLLPILTFSLALAGCSLFNDEDGQENNNNGGEQQQGPKEIWEEDLVEGESSFAQVKASSLNQYFKVRGTVAANVGNSFSLYRNGEFLYCYNFPAGQTELLGEHALGSYVEVYAYAEEYSGVQLKAYGVPGSQQDERQYDLAAKVTKLADRGETIVPKQPSAEADFENAKLSGAMVKVNWVADQDLELDMAETSNYQDCKGLVGDVKVQLRLDKYLPADVRTAIFPTDESKKLDIGCTYDLYTMATGTSSGSVRLTYTDATTIVKTGSITWSPATSVTIEAEGDLHSIEAFKTLQLDATVHADGDGRAKPVVDWSSDHADIAKVDEEGLVKGVKEGDAIITAASHEYPDVKGTYNIHVTPSTLVVTEIASPVVGTRYRAGVNQVKLDGRYFLNGQMDSFRAATVLDPAESIELELENASEGKYYLKAHLEDGDKYVNVVVDQANTANVNFLYQDAHTTEYTYNTTYKTLVCEVSGSSNNKKNGPSYIGAYGTNSGLTVSAMTYLKEDMSNYETASGQFPMHFFSVTQAPSA